MEKISFYTFWIHKTIDHIREWVNKGFELLERLFWKLFLIFHEKLSWCIWRSFWWSAWTSVSPWSYQFLSFCGILQCNPAKIGRITSVIYLQLKAGTSTEQLSRSTWQCFLLLIVCHFPLKYRTEPNVFVKQSWAVLLSASVFQQLSCWPFRSRTRFTTKTPAISNFKCVACSKHEAFIYRRRAPPHDTGRQLGIVRFHLSCPTMTSHSPKVGEVWINF